jgi:hypothetical protein
MSLCDPGLASLIKAKFPWIVGAIGRGLADPPAAPYPDHPQRDLSDRQSNRVA